MPPKSPLHASALGHWDTGRLDLALDDAWALYDAAPDDLDAKALVADLLRAAPRLAAPSRIPDLLRLVRDAGVNPASLGRAGWHAVQAAGALSGTQMAALASEVETSDLIRALLEEALVTVPAVEAVLTRLRRWFLLCDRWRDFPKTGEALARQAAHNGGAWLFDDQERARAEFLPGTVIANAYFPPPPLCSNDMRFADAITAAVADQYERWPYPHWTRVTRRAPKLLADKVQTLDPDGPDTIPEVPDILIAGCGTGREVASNHVRYPQARIVAIDISAQSLRRAASRLSQAGLNGAELKQLDLHDVASLGRRFDLISAIGVLHHLSDPEKGWAALASVLKPGGVMEIMVYSAVPRMRVRSQRAQFADLMDRPVDEDLLREVRRRAMARNVRAIVASPDFFSLPGVHDLLFHRHEDPFDVPRIGRALDALELELIAFGLPNRMRRARYRAEHPGDPLFRDRVAWAALERAEPTLFAGMYGLWCRRPVTR